MSVKFTSYKSEVLSAVDARIARALEICGGTAERYAKEICPVDTGNLRNSITHKQMDSKTEVIGTNVKYAPFVCLGTRRMRARPFLRPAVENHSAEYNQIIKSELSGL